MTYRAFLDEVSDNEVSDNGHEAVDVSSNGHVVLRGSEPEEQKPSQPEIIDTRRSEEIDANIERPRHRLSGASKCSPVKRFLGKRYLATLIAKP